MRRLIKHQISRIELGDFRQSLPTPDLDALVDERQQALRADILQCSIHVNRSEARCIGELLLRRRQVMTGSRAQARRRVPPGRHADARAW